METNVNSAESKGIWSQLQSQHRGQHFQKQIWAIGGGKGGVGKSLVSSSLAFTLAKHGFSTVAIDLDLGGANLHTVLGQPPPKKCVSDFLSGNVVNLSECLVDTQYSNLKLIGGAKDDLKITQITEDKKQMLMNQIRQIPAQFIILDLGAGTSQYTLDFFNLAQVGIITVLPEPTSIENAYRFLKAVYYHRLHSNPKFASIQPMIEAAMIPNNQLGIQSPTDLLNEVNFQNAELANELKKTIKEFKPKLVLNQTRSQTDIDVGFSMKSVAKKYFGVDLDYLGYLEYEPNVWQSVRKMRPFLIEHPHSKIATHVERICNYLLKHAKIEQTLQE
jgi:flagellar biosynthesis protein FlhG